MPDKKEPSPPSRRVVLIVFVVWLATAVLRSTTENEVLDFVPTAIAIVVVAHFLWFYARTGRTPLDRKDS